MRKILAQQCIVARDQNKVFVERTDSRKLSPADAEQRYELADGKGNAYVEFNIETELLGQQYNRRIEIVELYIVGSVDLTNRAPEAFFNI